MKHFLLILMIMLLTGTQPALGDPFQFFNGNYKELQERARTSGKPYFVYFYANWCMPCKKMNDVTFRDAELIKYASAKYYGFSADGESDITDGGQLAKRYEVNFFPMIVIFTPEGRVSEKIDGFLPPKELIAALKRNEKARGESLPGAAMLYDDPPASGIVIPSGKGLYKFYFERQPSEGYGVQMGIYENYEHVLDKVEELQNNFHRNIILHVDVVEGKTIFRVILGAFSSRRSALTYNELLLMKEGKNGVVVNLAEMK